MPDFSRFVLLSSVCLFSPVVHTASFNCEKATTSNEQMICSEPLLSSMDEQYSTMYRYLLDATKKDAARNKTIKTSATKAYMLREKTVLNFTACGDGIKTAGSECLSNSMKLTRQ